MKRSAFDGEKVENFDEKQFRSADLKGKIPLKMNINSTGKKKFPLADKIHWSKEE